MFGSTFLVVQDATKKASILAFLATRFLFGAALLWPIARRRPRSEHEISHGLAAGSCLLAGFILQTAGLRYTTSSTSAFITYLLVVFVPLIMSFLGRVWPTRSIVVSVVLAVIGLLLLSGGIDGFGLGEVLTLGCALAFALHMVVLGRTARRNDAIRLTFWQTLMVGGACLVPGFFTGGYGFGVSAWLAAAFCGLGATAIAFSCMVWAQRFVTEARAAIVLLLEPVFAALIGYVAGERLGLSGFVGATLILAAVLITELAPRRRARAAT